MNEQDCLEYIQETVRRERMFERECKRFSTACRGLLDRLLEEDPEIMYQGWEIKELAELAHIMHYPTTSTRSNNNAQLQ